MSPYYIITFQIIIITPITCIHRTNIEKSSIDNVKNLLNGKSDDIRIFKNSFDVNETFIKQENVQQSKKKEFETTGILNHNFINFLIILLLTYME